MQLAGSQEQTSPRCRPGFELLIVGGWTDQFCAPTTVSPMLRYSVGEAESYSIEKRYVRKDGGILWASLTVGCVRKTDGGLD